MSRDLFRHNSLFSLFQLILLVVFVNASISVQSGFAISATKIKLKTMCVGPIEVFSDNRGQAKLISLFGTVLITDRRTSFGYNDTSKQYIEYATPQAFRESRFVKLLSGGSKSGESSSLYLQWQELDEVKVKGWPLKRFRRFRNPEAVKRIQVRFANGPNANDPNLRRVVAALGKRDHYQVVSTTDAVRLPYEWVDPYVTALGAPCPPNRFPLYFYAYDGTRLVENRLELISITEEQVPADFFAVPQNYQLAQDDLELYLGGSQFSELFYQIKNGRLPQKGSFQKKSP